MQRGRLNECQVYYDRKSSLYKAFCGTDHPVSTERLFPSPRKRRTWASVIRYPYAAGGWRLELHTTRRQAEAAVSKAARGPFAARGVAVPVQNY